ncbi:MAG: Gfo/Idh/MocA family oxidoreductase [Bacteroidaceae bacterium]|nr:Gfo/Idh/MocA family oxidoreductase [Bacteroidaceae bacterium]
MIKKILFSVAFIATVLTSSVDAQVLKGKNWRVKDGVIVVDEPQRAKGQKSMLEFRAEPIKTVRVGFVGLGMRGVEAVKRFTHIEGVEIVGLCDKYADRVTISQNNLKKANVKPAAEYSGADGYKKLCERKDIDLIYIATNWQTHVPIALYAMEHGKHVAIEVPSAGTIEDCWKLVDTSERTRKHCMMLENCVYDFFELTCLNMAQKGVFGEVLHAEGAYIHNLEPYWDAYADNWRLEYNQKHGGDVYPTHGFGPCCQVMNIHRGDKMEYLTSVSTKSVNGLKLAQERMGSTTFATGDHIVTLIKTKSGKSLEIQHNTFTPRPYNRLYQLTGTEGFANKYPISGFTLRNKNVDRKSMPNIPTLDEHDFVPDSVKTTLLKFYQHPIHQEIEEKAKQVGGHGGMDFVMDYRLIYCLHNGLPLDQDVYDLAEWCCVSELSEISDHNNSMPVKVPDFTRGEWNKVKGLHFYMRGE